jgi:hypothetical protein
MELEWDFYPIDCVIFGLDMPIIVLYYGFEEARMAKQEVCTTMETQAEEAQGVGKRYRFTAKYS